MNIYEFIKNNYSYCFSDSNEIKYTTKDSRNLKFCYLDNDKKYVCGCYFLWYNNTYGFRRSISGCVLEFNRVIDVTQPLSSDFNVIEKNIEHLSPQHVKDNCENLLQEIKNQYIDENFSFDCIPINFMTKKQYTIINNNNIIISV